jgi:hypothetical protein
LREQDRSPDEDVSRREADADKRERDADNREAALDEREDVIQARETVGADQEKEARAILDDADERDSQADARDSKADDRDKIASLKSFLDDKDFIPGINARRAAGMDRLDSKGDRSSAAKDRSKLSETVRTNSEEEDSKESEE